MLRISCPWCGLRDQAEFRYGGEASIVRPPDPQSVSDDEWANYLFYRDNIKGVHQERWLHTYGCRQWFIATRSTITHEITQTLTMAQATAQIAAQAAITVVGNSVDLTGGKPA